MAAAFLLAYFGGVDTALHVRANQIYSISSIAQFTWLCVPKKQHGFCALCLTNPLRTALLAEL
jgi:hypothetical protein